MPRKTFDKTLCCKPHPVKMISSTLKIHPNSLYRWIQEYEKYEESAFPGHGSALRHTQFEI